MFGLANMCSTPLAYPRDSGVHDPQFTRNFVGTLRLITQSLDLLPMKDLSEFFKLYRGPAEGADFISSINILHFDDPYLLKRCYYFPVLATALRNTIRYSGWEPVIRRLLRQRADVHARVYIGGWQYIRLIETWGGNYPCDLPRYGTPLDSLFGATNDPPEGSSAARRWLEILASEGYDVRAYLRQEQSLHNGHPPYFSFAAHNIVTGFIRQLKFDIEGDNPMVWWEWWCDLSSPAFLVLEEFQWLNGLSVEVVNYIHDWSVSWPFHNWCVNYRTPLSWEFAEREERLRDKRWKRKIDKKRAKAIKKRKELRIPGAWPG